MRVYVSSINIIFSLMLMACTSSSHDKVAPNGVSHAGVQAPLTTNTGVCTRLRINMLNRDGYSVPSSAETFVFHLSSSSSSTGAFYSDDQCATANPTAVIGTNSSSVFAFYRDTAAGNPQLTATYDGSFAIDPGTTALTVVAAPAAGTGSGT